VICINSNTQWLEVVNKTSAEPDFLEMTLNRLKFSQGRSKPWVRVLARIIFSFKGSVGLFVEKRGDCGIVSVDKVIEINRKVSDD